MKLSKKIMLTCIISSTLFSGMSLAQGVSTYTHAKLLTAERLEKSGDLTKAIKTLESTQTNAKYDQAFIARILGIYYWEENSAEKSIASLQTALDLNQLESSAQWQTRRMLADILYSEDSMDKAISLYNQLLDENDNLNTKDRSKFQSDINQIHFRLSAAYYQKENWQATKAHLIQFNAEDKAQNLQAKQMLLMAQVNLKDWPGADKTGDSLIRLEPENKSWWQQKIYAQTQSGDLARALDTYSLAMQHGIQFESHDYQMLAQLYAQNNIYEKAARIYDDMFEKFPKTQTLENQKIQANYWQMGKDWGKATQAWQNLAKQDEQFNWQLTQLFAQQGQYQKALVVIDKAQPYAGANDYALTKVNLLYKLNRYNDALAHAKRFYERSPSESVKSWIGFLEGKITMQKESKKSDSTQQAEQVAQLDKQSSTSRALENAS